MGPAAREHADLRCALGQLRPPQEGPGPRERDGVAARPRLARTPAGLQPAEGIHLRPHRLQPERLRRVPAVGDDAVDHRRHRPQRDPRRRRQRGLGHRLQGRDCAVCDLSRYRGDPTGAREGLRERRSVQVAARRLRAGSAQAGRPRRRARTWDRAAATAMLLPSVVAIAVFVYGFVGWTGYVSLTRWNDVLPNYAWAGLRTYADLFDTFRFRIALLNTLKFTLAFLAGCLGVGFTLAVLLDRGLRGETIFRTIFLAPLAISFIVTGVVWRWLLNPGSAQLGSVGINLLLERAHLGALRTGWYTDPRIGILAVALAALWQLSGYTMALYLAGLRSIPDDLREAARVDGAGEWQVYRRILMPLLQPITLSAVIILGHISLKIFDLVVAMTGSGPGFSSDVPAYFMFDTTFRGNHFAQGAAIAEILLVLVALLTVPYLVYSTRTEASR